MNGKIPDNSHEIKFFISYSQKDEKLWNEQVVHLSVLRRQGFINNIGYYEEVNSCEDISFSVRRV